MKILIKEKPHLQNHIITKILLILILCIIGEIKLLSQVERETRAVWISTNFRLDWPPPTFDSEIQKKELVKILDDVKRKNLNTVYFQVRFNGTVLFRSSYEPYSYYINGITGSMPTYDPLRFAIKEAHKRGLEIHAWVNVMRLFSGSTEEFILEHPDHLFQKHPNWIIKKETEGKPWYWLDSGLPEVREYLVNLFSEIPMFYNVDGIQLDFMRYPQGGFDDSFSYAAYGNGQNKDDWRRSNITNFLDSLYNRVKSINPFIKVGVTPIGIYKSQRDKGFAGMEGFYEVYQDSRTWLKKGIVDYLAPQVYWNINDIPKFEPLSKDWIDNSYGRNIVIGIAAYKDDVFSEMEEMIAITRKLKSAGIAFFRYGNIENHLFNSFKKRSYPSTMDWIDSQPPIAPSGLSYDVISNNPFQINLKWKDPSPAYLSERIEYFSLYKFDSPNQNFDSDNLFEIIDNGGSSLRLIIKRPARINSYFAVKSVDKLWNESEGSSNKVKVSQPYLTEIANSSNKLKNPILIKSSNGVSKIILFSKEDDEIVINGISSGDKLELYSNNINFGINQIELKTDLSKFDKLVMKFNEQNEEVLQLRR